MSGQIRPIRRVVFSLGSNVGDREVNLQDGIDSLLEAPGHPPGRGLAGLPDHAGRRPGAGRLLQRRPRGRHRPAGPDDAGALPRGRGGVRPRARRALGPAHARHRRHRDRRPAQGRPRLRSCRTRVRTSGRSCSRRGWRSTPRRRSPAAAPVRDLLADLDTSSVTALADVELHLPE